MKLFQQFKMGELDGFGKQIAEELYKKRPSWAVASISVLDAAHVVGLVKSIKPKKLVEIGVASGWGSVILMDTLRDMGVHDFEYVGIDISFRFFHDPAFATGQAVDELLPDLASHYQLIVDKSAGQVLHEIGDSIDFGFIDAHHMHPWALLDFLSILPYMAEGSWVALHDLNLSRKAKYKHKNRGPKYLFEGWTGDKVHSIENPTMIGAIKIEDSTESDLECLLDILYTPWEIPIHRQYLDPVIRIIDQFYGNTWAAKFEEAFEFGNRLVNKTNSREIERLSSEVNRLRLATESSMRDVDKGIFRSKDD